MIRLGIRIRGAGLSVDCLRRYSPVTRPTYSRKSIGEIADTFLSLKIDHVPCASVRGAVSVPVRKTGALERVLRATGRYSMRRWGSDAPSTTTSRSKAHRLLKVSEGKRVGAEVQDERGSGVYGQENTL